MSDSQEPTKPETPPEKKESNAPEPPKKKIPFIRPPVSTWQWIFWLMWLVAIPAFLWMRSGDNNGNVRELTQSQFEQRLTSGLVREVNITEPSSGAVCIITGQMVMPADGALVKKEETAVSNPPQLVDYTTKVLFTETVDKLIRQHCKKYTVRAAGTSFSTYVYMLLPTLLLIGFFYFMYVRQMRGNAGMMNFGKSRARRMSPNEKPVHFSDVAGCAEAKEDMQEIVDYLKSPQQFSRLGGKIPSGVLLVGPPGTGKTLLAKAIAGEANVPFYSISGSDFVEMFVGVGASRVRDMFEEGKRNAPCLIFIDEIDAVGRSRFSGIGGGHDEREQTLNALLVEMDGFEPNQGVIVLAASNRPDVLDPALLRPGRFDRQIVVDLPDLRGRLAILKIHARKTKLAEEVDLRIIARGTPGFSGADLANLINEAALLATRRKLDAVGMAELEESRDKVRWGKERRSHRMDDRVRRMTAFHEAGHALVGMLCEHSTPLHKITIIPRGQALGATMSLPENDEFTKSRQELLDHIAMCFGGRIAEELLFQDISTGASMDIRQATDIAKKMVCQWGMSDNLGLINYAGREEHLFLGRDITRSEDFSQDTAREIDLEIRKIMEFQRQRVTNLLTTHRDKLEKLGEALLEQETLSAEEAYRLLDMAMPQSKRSQEDLLHDLDDEPLSEEIRECLKETEQPTSKEAPAESTDTPEAPTAEEEKPAASQDTPESPEK